jgi:hypothetical protein
MEGGVTPTGQQSMADTDDADGAFEAAFLAEYADFHVALQDELPLQDARMLQHVATMSAMVQHNGGGDGSNTAGEGAAAVRRELLQAAIQKARGWVELRTQQLVGEFHMRWHEDDRGPDLLAVDRALRESLRLVHAAETSLGELPVCVEVLGACAKQLHAQLAKHVRKANRHELRVLYADFCRWEGVGREELQTLCLEKYREQVDKHVQSEAVATQMLLLGLLAARDAPAVLMSAPGASGAASSGVASGEAGEERSTIQVLNDYLEGVAGFSEELSEPEVDEDGSAVELPPKFIASVLREVEQEACTQALELSSHVLQIETRLSESTDRVQLLADEEKGQGDGGPRDSAAREATISELDVRLEETSGLLQLLHTFALWCDDLPPVEKTAPAVRLGRGESVVGGFPTEGVAAASSTTAASTVVISPPSSMPLQQEQAEMPQSVPNIGLEDQLAPGAGVAVVPPVGAIAEGGGCDATAASAADAAMAAVSTCTAALGVSADGAPAAPVTPALANAENESAQQTEPAPAPAALSSRGGRRTEARQRLDAYTQGLACAYLQGEMGYLDCAVHLATELTEVDAESLTLSVVDDVFFVLLKAFTRSVHTGAATLAVIPLLNSLVEALRTRCLPVLQKYLRHAGAAEAANERFIVGANSMQCAHEYAQRLSSVVSTSFEQNFPEMVTTAEICLGELASLAEECSEAASRAMRLLAVELRPTAWLRVDFEPASFELQTEQAEADVKQSFEAGLLHPLHARLSPLQEGLRPQNVETLVHAVAAGLAEEIESVVMEKRFNESGAMLLSELTRRTTDRLSELVSGSVRHELGRLNQIAFLLNAGSVQEAAALLLSTASISSSGGDGGGVRLTRKEAGRVLRLRSDLPREDISSLFDVDDDGGHCTEQGGGSD